jgi:hypothetical protein
MIVRVVERLEPFSEAIGELAQELDRRHHRAGAPVWLASGASLQVVRYFNDEEGEEENTYAPRADWERLPGQHQLLGWGLDSRILQFLISTRAELEMDAYGY